MNQSSLQKARERLAGELINTGLFQSFQSAFQVLTGMDLQLEAWPEELAFSDAPQARPGCRESDAGLPVRVGKSPVAVLGMRVPEAAVRAGRVPTAGNRQAALVMMQSFAFQLSECASRYVFACSQGEPQAVRAAKSYILKHLADPMTLEQVAAHAHVSPFHFCKIFKRSTGTTFTDFVNRARVERARRMLMHPNARITNVAYDAGFQSLSHFNRSFRKIAGETPSQFRQAIRSQPVFSLEAA